MCAVLPSFRPGRASPKKTLANLAACTTDQIAALIRTRLKRMQYRPGPLDGVIAETGLVLTP
ncbi:hypothetical protein [Streptomyces sp. NPDC050388]|uniref:hypothetical protein n=1 Tax=Streptomyces sp. NPDC050388 TaxID=3155781 RepID=UPI00341BF891